VEFQIWFSIEAAESLACLEQVDIKKCRKVKKTLALMQTNLRHPSLCTHKYDEYTGPAGEEVFESYVENKTPGAYRVFWCYGPPQRIITILAITPHP